MTLTRFSLAILISLSSANAGIANLGFCFGLIGDYQTLATLLPLILHGTELPPY